MQDLVLLKKISVLMKKKEEKEMKWRKISNLPIWESMKILPYRYPENLSITLTHLISASKMKKKAFDQLIIFSRVGRLPKTRRNSIV